VPLVGIAEVEQAGLVGAEDGAIGSLVVLLGLGGGGRQGSKGTLITSGDELGVAEALVVAAVAEELGSILEELGKLCLIDAGLLRQALPVAAGGLVKADDEVIDGLGLGGDLSEDDTVPSEGGPEGVSESERAETRCALCEAR